MAVGQRLRILYLAANPIDTPQLRLDQELRDINSALRLAKNRHLMELHASSAVRIEDMRRAMLECEPDVVHFAGHGDVSGIYMESSTGKAHVVAASSLGKFFANFPCVQCVVLNACYSSELGREINRTVPYVVGMHSPVEDLAAITFAVAFYDVLGAGGTYTLAFNLAVNALEMEKKYDIPKPVLHQRRHTGDTGDVGQHAETTTGPDSVSNQRTYSQGSNGCSGVDSKSRRPFEPSTEILETRWHWNITRFAEVYGITPGKTRYQAVINILGEPTQSRLYDGKLQALYADFGLRITFEREPSENPHIQYMQIDAARSSELPHGLHRDMTKQEWLAVLTKVYGPEGEHESPANAVFEPPSGVPGNKVVVMLRGDRIHSVVIYSLRLHS